MDADYAALRCEMVETQLRPRGISDPRVLAAMSEVPRQEFVPDDLRQHAYDDGALPIGRGQTISQPYVVAIMAQEARIHPDDRVLEVGTGSGYAAAVLGRLCREVHSVELIPELAEVARQRLARLGYSNVFTHVSDGTLGLASHAPFAAILVPAAASEPPGPLLHQLVPGGRLIIPIGTRDSQRMMRLTLQVTQEDLGAFAFVPLVGAQ